MPGMTPTPFSLHTALTAWQWSPFSVSVALAVIFLAVLYLRGDWRLAARGRRWPRHRTLAFIAGLLAIDIALQSPVATFAGSYFQAHVVQHLLLMAVAPPLLALGAPSTLLLQAGSRRTQTRWLSVLRSRPFAVLTHPFAVVWMYFGAMFAFFLTPLINYAMLHMALMDVINLAFLFGGCCYWWPMVGLDPIVHWKMGYGARIANLAIGIPFESFLGIAIMSEHSPIASMYSLTSTHAGGALLWAATELSTFVGIVPVFFQWARSDEREAARADARADARASRMRAELPDQARLDVSLSALSGRRPVPAAGMATAGAGAGPGAPGGGAGAGTGNRFRPLFQDGNAAWEQMWRAKAGRSPTVAYERNSPPGTPGVPPAPAPGASPSQA